MNGTHLSADSNTFLEKRRRGLIRFTNSLVRHPVLGQEQLVVMFLTVPTVSGPWFPSLEVNAVSDNDVGAFRLA